MEVPPSTLITAFNPIQYIRYLEQLRSNDIVLKTKVLRNLASLFCMSEECWAAKRVDGFFSSLHCETYNGTNEVKELAVQVWYRLSGYECGRQILIAPSGCNFPLVKRMVTLLLDSSENVRLHVAKCLTNLGTYAEYYRHSNRKLPTDGGVGYCESSFPCFPYSEILFTLVVRLAGLPDSQGGESSRLVRIWLIRFLTILIDKCPNASKLTIDTPPQLYLALITGNRLAALEKRELEGKGIITAQYLPPYLPLQQNIEQSIHITSKSGTAPADNEATCCDHIKEAARFVWTLCLQDKNKQQLIDANAVNTLGILIAIATLTTYSLETNKHPHENLTNATHELEINDKVLMTDSFHTQQKREFAMSWLHTQVHSVIFGEDTANNNSQDRPCARSGINLKALNTIRKIPKWDHLTRSYIWGVFATVCLSNTAKKQVYEAGWISLLKVGIVLEDAHPCVLKKILECIIRLAEYPKCRQDLQESIPSIKHLSQKISEKYERSEYNAAKVVGSDYSGCPIQVKGLQKLTEKSISAIQNC